MLHSREAASLHDVAFAVVRARVAVAGVDDGLAVLACGYKEGN